MFYVVKFRSICYYQVKLHRTGDIKAPDIENVFAREIDKDIGEWFSDVK